MWDGYLSSGYNSFQSSVNRSFSKGLSVKGAYTWSHAIDYVDEDGWASTMWNWGPVFQRNRASAGFDQRHVFSLAWVYDLPVGKGKQFVNSGIVSHVIGGWQLSGIHSSYTGTPFTITAPGTSLNAGPSNQQTADQFGAVQFLGGVGTSGYYYAPTSFAAVILRGSEPPRFGTTGRNIVRNPGLWNTDLSISRNFAITERAQLQFRTEFYNLPNTSHFWGPGVLSSGAVQPTTQNVTASNFMRIVGSYGERNIRFALRLQW